MTQDEMVATLDRCRSAEVEFKIAHAKAIVKHRGEGDEYIVLALAMVDCEKEYREWNDAMGEAEKVRLGREDVLLDAHKASAEYHRSWATRQHEWAAE